LEHFSFYSHFILLKTCRYSR